MLRPKRRQGGLGDPPIAFTTNASESVNALLKNQVEYKKSDVPVFLDNLQAAIDEQQKEIERAIIDKGKYKFKEKFRTLVKNEDDWFLKMSLTQKENHIERVASVSLQPKKPSKGKHKLIISTPVSEVPSTSNEFIKVQKSRGGQELPDHPFEVPSTSKEVVQLPKSCVRRQLFSS